MNQESRLRSYLSTWKDEYSKTEVSHLPDDVLYQMAEEGGVAEAPAEAVEHLSFCPVCMENWAAWRDAISVVEEDDEENAPRMSFGYLKAAAIVEKREPISSLSTCGRFKLKVEPPLDTGGKWLVILEATADAGSSFEGRNVEVRDKNNRMLLDGKIEQGRLARFRSSLDDFDLSTWTWIEKLKEES